MKIFKSANLFLLFYFILFFSQAFVFAQNIIIPGAIKGTGIYKNTNHKLQSVNFPPEITEFSPYEHNPVFSGTGIDTWDKTIRERGYILRENGAYYMWFSGYNKDYTETKYLGYATSEDGINWIRYSDSPVFNESWIEDVFVIKHENVYYMFAEGEGDIAHMLTSTDRIHWQDHGSLDIRTTDNEPVSGRFGTPTVWIENQNWYLFYERDDEGIWLAFSNDLNTWINVQDEPVIQKGPEEYDKYAVALNQVIKYEGKYYGYYHGSPSSSWSTWTTNIAVSSDLVHWEKYSNNPILSDNKSSAILVFDGQQYRLYAMHPDVHLYLSAATVPVELSFFSGKVKNDYVELYWATASESNNYGFYIMKSRDGINFNEIGFVKGSGTSNRPGNYKYIDRDVDFGKYYYQLKQIDTNGGYSLSGIIMIDIGLPVKYQLLQNFPNPFNSSTKIKFVLPEAEVVRLDLYNYLGIKIETLLNKYMNSGSHEIEYKSPSLPSGIYICKMEAGNFQAGIKMLYLK